MEDVNVCDYTDYRTYLQDYYEDRKKKNGNFSYQLLSQKAQIKSRGFLHNVIKGKRNLSKSNIVGLISALKLNKHEADYFDTLVAFNHSENLEEKNYCFEKLTEIKSKGKKSWKTQTIRKDQFEFYSRIYHSIVRSLIGMYPFKGDFDWLSKSIIPKVTIKDLKKSVNLLEKLGFISRETEDDSYKLTSNNITTPAELRSLAIQNYHKDSALHALNAITEQSADERYMSGVMVGISSKGYERICTEMDKFREQVMNIVEEDSNAENVYNLNLQFYPLSNIK